MSELEYAYWIEGDDYDPGIDYCYNCAVKKVAFYEDGDNLLCGGYPTEHDSPPQCETCFQPLGGIILQDGKHISTLQQWLSRVEADEAINVVFD